MTRDEQIRAATVGELKPLTSRIVVADYDPAWPGLYAREEARIRRALGDGVRRIEHVGSTAVPGLAAKPCIDIVLAVADSSDEDSYLPALVAAGYVLRIREPDWFAHRVFKGPDTNVNLHVFPVGCPEIDELIRFRDWLRAQPEDRQRYGEKKRELAERDWQYMQHYADAKTEIVSEIKARARAAAVASFELRRDDR